MNNLTVVFLVHHIRELEDDTEEVKFIGVFSTKENAIAAVDRIKSEPGFCDFPDGFDIEPQDLDRIGWLEGFYYNENPQQRDNSKEA